ncbi:class 1 fructose-bisphosphatase [Psychrosphaera sp. B3R10]|uniref:Fructose-1,6-bisphosphatase class 1 n=1 Tax=Psychrosphaera algicola TaxID=3023714 RepID=A0ABT5FH51_9GAMM|nr:MULTISPECIES: class 1 fructose-bisphosphatase [unclassified Psychrosphaera]MBU2881960.1 class 1 fructose-bisphosphatase [Psychrosphaera sp. I2R16]MBU2991271.1 class 1 fructose-bisphosphatase [Psychrosphaera sp. B3R10]MDC2890521.1 class 1 fructose-bisphosphatase [Psychrosphaera sp. G1-22]MDO6720963.1 class 1 fructose-bisphosphatase [Psychrosphaera sp. 1_MG-2023]
MRRLAPVLREDGVELDLISLIRTILAACKDISFRVGQADLAGVLGSTLDENIQGETQKKLDILSNQLLKDMLLESGFVRAIASEEEDFVVEGIHGGRFLVAFDPLDGSSNIDVNSLTGTIFSIMPVPADKPTDEPITEQDFLQPGRNQVAAGYVMYGPSTILALTTGKGVKFYTLDKTHGSFLLTQEAVTIEEETQEFAINSSNQHKWEIPMQRYIRDILDGKQGIRGKNFNMRWVACMVGDVHRILCRGGIFTYPAHTDEVDKPFKLRLLYEANPMGLLIEQAGGLISTGSQNILDIQPTELHQRVPVILGSKQEVLTCLDYHNY